MSELVLKLQLDYFTQNNAFQILTTLNSYLKIEDKFERRYHRRYLFILKRRSDETAVIVVVGTIGRI